MKTALVSACYLHGQDASGSSRLERNIRYVNYYTAIREYLGFDAIYLLDNASSADARRAVIRSCPDAELRFVNYPDHIERKGPLDYGYCWRALYEMKNLMEHGYEKFLLIDSDYFILSGNLAHFIRTTNTGWYSLYCELHKFPEAACQVLNKDAFGKYLEFTSIPWEQHNGKMMENALPFTEVYKQFKADRFGEMAVPQSEDMSGYGQAGSTTVLEFRP